MLRKILSVACVGLCLSCSNLLYAGTLELDFANTTGANLSFNGHNGTFSFTPDGSGHEFVINNVSGGTGSALNLFGTISGTFTIGSISTVGGLSSAPVSGSGVVTIADGLGNNFTADITMSSINKFGSIGMINPTEVVNLSNLHYTGSNSDLQSLTSGLNPTALLGFFNSHTLAQLKSGGQTVNTGFSGSLSAVVPEPGSMVLALAAAPALGGFWFSRRRRKEAV
ncbi:MAG TPA: PEP-CTERM sorting domain-containing protein [Pirellulales bacterium]|nr:PEP-CTERM sorting domain-containing protein [Pirellulales bacterium]